MNSESGLADTVALVRATHFGANPDTLASNAFQAAVSAADATARALEEQHRLADALQAAGVNVLMLEPASISPDAVFPNNWFTTHADGTLVLYPMQAPSRRRERFADMDERLRDAGFRVNEIIDLSAHEREARFLEGTGSLVLDRVNRIAYACPSVRTNHELARAWAERFGYELCWFTAQDPQGRPVYHTNVVLSLGAGLALVCLDAVINPAERAGLQRRLMASGLEIVALDWTQVTAFAGNQLLLQGDAGVIAVLSVSADRALRSGQKAMIDQHARRVAADTATIEKHGGGGVRCMLAEIFLPRDTGEK